MEMIISSLNQTPQPQLVMVCLRNKRSRTEQTLVWWGGSRGLYVFTELTGSTFTKFCTFAPTQPIQNWSKYDKIDPDILEVSPPLSRQHIWKTNLQGWKATSYILYVNKADVPLQILSLLMCRGRNHKWQKKKKSHLFLLQHCLIACSRFTFLRSSSMVRWHLIVSGLSCSR